MLEKFLKKTTFMNMDDLQANYELIIPDNFNFAYDVMDKWAETHPDKLALNWINSANQRALFTFGDLKRESDKMAAYFQQLGIGKGDVVMLILKRRFEFWFAMLALHKLGAVAIPATHMLTASDLVYRNNAADVKMIVATDDSYLIKHVNASLPGSPTVRQLLCVGEEIPEGWRDVRREYPQAGEFKRAPETNHNHDISLIYFTSGTTGDPKMVAHDYLYPLGHITTAKYWHNLTEESLHLTMSDTGWGKAVWGKLYGQWIVGAAVFAFDHDIFKPRTILSMIEEFRITSFCAPPTVYGMLVREDLSEFDLSSLTYCCAAGEPLNPIVFDKFHDMTGLKIYEAFGQTETTPTIVTFPWVEPRPGAMGMLNPAYDMDLIDEDGNSVGVGEPGEIVIRVDRRRPVGLFRGYYKNEALTAKAFAGGVYHTGDMATKDADGYLWFMGRNDDVIKSSGYRVGSFEVENTLMKHPYIQECAVTGVHDKIRGQVIKATIVLAPEHKDKAGDKLAKEIQHYVKEQTASYKMPRIVEFIDILPKTTNGKVKRSSLRASTSSA